MRQPAPGSADRAEVGVHGLGFHPLGGLAVTSPSTTVPSRPITNVAVAGGRPGDMTVWFLKDDRSSFEEGELEYGDQNPDSNTAPAVHR